ncbi:MAG: hypothetical protein O2968_23530 [Acidobacteria bacterium]|nr:hypothetical protein [Acidobacteriota bacterium]
MTRSVQRWLPAVLAAVSVAGFGQEPSLAIREASGLTRSGDHLLIVDDSQPGAYFRFRLQGETGPRILIESSRLERIPLPQSSMATDLESINVLADGRVVVLSERLRALFDALGPVADYEATFSEFGKRGLEGLAVRDMGGGQSRLAVLWEGGYPEFYDVPEQLRAKVGRKALNPVVQVHDLNPGERGIKVGGSGFATLDVPKPKGRGPRAQRFRAPDLVWHRFAGGEWGFIVLLTSQNSVDPRKYEYHWLECFDLHGKRLGKRLDLDAVTGEGLEGVNWEGLDWFEEGKSLILIHESYPSAEPTAFVWQLPEDWKAAGI